MSLDNTSEFIEHLHCLVTAKTQNYWLYYLSENSSDNAYEIFQAELLESITGNKHGYLVFPKGGQLAWFYQKFTIPNNINN